MILPSPVGAGLLHRVPAGPKLAGLAVAALALTMVPQGPISIAVCLVAVIALYPIAGVPLSAAGTELWRLRAVLVVLAVALAVFVSPVAAWVSTGRVAALLLLAALLTLTTRMSDLLALLQRLLRPVRRVGMDPEAVSMAVSLTLTMVPVVAGFAQRVRDAERARGVRLGVRGVVPLLVLTLRHADQVGDALAARGVG
ncbi:energy-coupling factor transporter transmembrane component T [Microbacterium sp. K36]|uniref:energy-coupling factor transporter transmembrane component T n=1 Tax=Microbacterium sp. K36 TaxID=2305439 RepID=UPI00109D37DC|nr:energy-coupling factor transporter transmembrane component T [Microbacterium sp. K36]